MLGTTVVAGMTAATLLGIFFVPALFVFIERLGGHRDTDHASAEEKSRAAAEEKSAAAAKPGGLPGSPSAARLSGAE